MADSTPESLRQLIEAALENHPEEVAMELERAPLEEAADLLIAQKRPERWAPVVRALSTERAARLLETLPAGMAGALLEHMDPPAAAMLLSRTEDDARQEILKTIERGAQRELEALLSYPPDSAGRIMDPRVLAFSTGSRVAEVLERLRAASWKRFDEIFVLGARGELDGVLLLQELVLAPPETRLSELRRTPHAVATAMATREEVVELLDRTRLPVIPVVDAEGRLLGAVRYEALLTAAKAEASADLLTMVGASRDERALSPVSFAVKKRLPWLEFNLLTAFLAASVVGIFEDTIARTTALAVLLPVVAGQSGNTGAQALAVVMRGLALREIRLRQWARVLSKELLVGALNGVAVAATTAFVVFLWSRSTGLALIIGASMVISMAIAGLSGGAVPLALRFLGQDPAQSSSIILTTVTDVVGFFSFLGIATLLSEML
jgi:magnesium transporter